MTDSQFVVLEFVLANSRVIVTDPVPAQTTGSDERVVAHTLAGLETSFMQGELLHVKQEGRSIGINTRHVVTVKAEVYRRPT